jgi:hypothetical protein
MKTSLKILIAGAVTAMAATFSTGASAASLIELHEQHKAQILGFLFGGSPQATISVGPAYQAPPVYQAPAYGYGHRDYRDPHWNGRRDDRRYDHDRRDGRGYHR